ncbi:MAG: tRNA adenylyltransferase, partial [Planctomycetaceae bacterium]|nr:tRNA adenylyltransferase [Planctomycetaceae bacterium]
MPPTKLRRKIAWEAARLPHQQQVTGYYQPRMKAARRLHKGWVKPRDLPSNPEIR